jgi:predicted MFS family arabinose efflux permease
LLLLSFIQSLAGLYAGLFLGAAFSAAVWPVGIAMISESQAEQGFKARSIGRIYVAVTAGLLAGPALGGLLAGRTMSGMPGVRSVFLAAAAVTAAALVVASLALPGHRHRTPAGALPRQSSRALTLLLLLAFLSAWGIGSFEVGLTLRAATEFGLSPHLIGWMFVECMIVMILAQTVTFNRFVDLSRSRRLLAPAYAFFALSLFLLTLASGQPGLFVAVAGVAAAAGLIAPLLGYWISMAAGRLPGTQLGRQTSFASLGQALGAAAAGMFSSMPFRGAGLALASGLLLAGCALALSTAARLRHLAAQPSGQRPGPIAS